MARGLVWIADVPFASGDVSSGPVSLALGTSVLRGPEGFDIGGGAGEVLQDAANWFFAASDTATSHAERRELLVSASRALNNLAVWCITRRTGERGFKDARIALNEALKVLNQVNHGGTLKGGVYFNLGNVLFMLDQPEDGQFYLNLAYSFGVGDSPLDRALKDGEELTGRFNRRPPSGLELDHESPTAMVDGKTQLMFWSALDSAENVRTLLRRGLDPNAGDDDGDTAIFYAASSGALHALTALLEWGANPNIGGKNGPPIRTVASRGWIEGVELLARYGADVNASGPLDETGGVTALMQAAGAGQVETLLTLILLGANPRLTDSDGDSALFYARSNGRKHAADILRNFIR